MQTGEGKTLVATAPAVYNAVIGNKVHIVTVNDYLALRDWQQMGQLYSFLGISSGVILSKLSSEQRKESYSCEIVYGTNNEFFSNSTGTVDLPDNSVYLYSADTTGTTSTVKNYTNFKNQKKILVGSTPPKSDGFWSTMKSKGFDVYTYERKLNGEKAVDSKIIAKGVSFIVQQDHSATLNLLSGDFDMFPLIEEALEKNWIVNLWSWKDSLSNEYLDAKEITIKYLDDVAEDLIYFNRDIDGYYEKEYLKEREIRLAREKQVIEFNQAKQGAKNKISRLRYIDKNIYLERIDELVNFEQISDIDRIVSAAKSENLNLKNEAIEKEAEQRRQKEEQKRLDKEAKKQEIKEFIKENQGKIVTGVAAFAGLISYAIKKIKK